MKPEAPAAASMLEPQLSPNFAARVLQRAHLESRRRFQRRVALGTGLGLALVVAAIPIMRGIEPAHRDVAPSSTTYSAESAQADLSQEDAAMSETDLAEADTASLTDSAETEQADASGYLFPDAQSLADFAENYRSDSIDYSSNEAFDTVASNY